MRLLIIGGSDPGIKAGLPAMDRDPALDVTVLAADRYPNFSICGIPYYTSRASRHGDRDLPIPENDYPPITAESAGPAPVAEPV